ncbi:MAG: hypothetical protein AAGF94_11140 [Pseudomonadota bacterium]
MQTELEIIMLICFSISWYWSIGKMLITGEASGKSAFFVFLVSIGYLCGIGSKFALWHTGGALHGVVWLYVWNLWVTLLDLFLVLRLPNSARDDTALAV